MNTLSRRLVLLSSAVLSAAAGLAVLLAAGFPTRLEHAGYLAYPDRLPMAPEIGARAPLFDLPRLAGSRLRLADLHGAPVVINFWATWCAPCRLEMPALQQLHEDYSEAGLRVLGINAGETTEAVQRWRAAFNLGFDLLLDTDQTVAARYQLRGYPTTYVVSPAGVITNVFYGPVSADHLRAALAPLLPARNQNSS